MNTEPISGHSASCHLCHGYNIVAIGVGLSETEDHDCPLLLRARLTAAETQRDALQGAYNNVHPAWIAAERDFFRDRWIDHSSAFGRANPNCDALRAENARLHLRDTELREALEGMCGQYLSVRGGKLHHDFMSAGERAFDALGWDDAGHVVDASCLCDVPGCGDGWSSGWKDAVGTYRTTCHEHYSAALAQPKEAEATTMPPAGMYFPGSSPTNPMPLPTPSPAADVTDDLIDAICSAFADGASCREAVRSALAAALRAKGQA